MFTFAKYSIKKFSFKIIKKKFLDLRFNCNVKVMFSATTKIFSRNELNVISNA